VWGERAAKSKGGNLFDFFVSVAPHNCEFDHREQGGAEYQRPLFYFGR
jgi:hypothetical protein